MFDVIKDRNGLTVRKPTRKYCLELADDTIVESDSLREAVAAIVGNEYVDCEYAETEWMMRLNAAKMIGLFLRGVEDQDRTIVYDSRIGKIPYSYTDPDVDYDIPEDPEVIYVETDKSFIYSLVLIEYVNLYVRQEDGTYKHLRENENVEEMLKKELEPFEAKYQSVPLHKRLGE